MVDLSKNVYFPMRSYLTFAQKPKFELLTKKLLEFNGKVEGDSKIEEEHLNRLHMLCLPGKVEFCSIELCVDFYYY